MFTYFFLCVFDSIFSCKNTSQGHMLYCISICIHVLLIIQNMDKTLLHFFLARVFTSIAWNPEYEKPILFRLHPPLFTGADPLSFPSFLLPLSLLQIPTLFGIRYFSDCNFSFNRHLGDCGFIIFYSIFLLLSEKPHTVLWCSLYSSEPLWA